MPVTQRLHGSFDVGNRDWLSWKWSEKKGGGTVSVAPEMIVHTGNSTPTTVDDDFVVLCRTSCPGQHITLGTPRLRNSA